MKEAAFVFFTNFASAAAAARASAVQTAFESVSLEEILSVNSVPNFIDMPPVGGAKPAPAVGEVE